jgi:hypothetical protein
MRRLDGRVAVVTGAASGIGPHGGHPRHVVLIARVIRSWHDQNKAPALLFRSRLLRGIPGRGGTGRRDGSASGQQRTFLA